MTLSLFLAALLAPVPAAGESGQPVLVRYPPDAHSSVPRAVDHVATLVGNRGSGPPGEHRIVVTRSGDWQMEERDGRAVHSNLRSGTSFSYWRDPGGRVVGLSIARMPSDSNRHVYRRVRTGERDIVLGEGCEVWSTVPIAEPVPVIDIRSCETLDGITLWHRSISIRTGWVLSEYRAVSFERRKVRKEEVMPPRNLLRWSYWRDFGAAPRLAPSDAKPIDYVLLMASNRTAIGPARIVRRRYPWTYHEDRDGGGRYLNIDNRTIQIRYREDSEGHPLGLEVHRAAPAFATRDDRFGLVPRDPPIEHTVLGERCVWHALGEIPGNIAVSSTNSFCFTADAIPLAHVIGDRVIYRLEATSLDRRSPPIKDVLPPQEIFSWAWWGTPPPEPESTAADVP